MTPSAVSAVNVLDLVPIVQGGTAADALDTMVTTAVAAESYGYRRYWLAEHHNLDGVASSATPILIGRIAAATTTLRVGSGGVMLPNHAPYLVAEQFGTLAEMFGDRIDLGLGRAPGTDQATAAALRRDDVAAMDFGREILELRGYLEPGDPEHPARVRAVPGEGTRVPIWVLGSSHGGAQVAAALGLPYAFASHFAPQALMSALEVYRSGFTAVDGGPDRPTTMAGANVMVADTAVEAERLFTSFLSRVASIVSGDRGPLRPPVDPAEQQTSWDPRVRAAVQQMSAVSFVGTPDVVRDQVAEFAKITSVDELIVTCSAYDPDARLRSLQLFAEAVAG